MLDGRTQVYPSAVWRSTYLGTDEQLTKFLALTDADAAVLSRGEARMEAALRRLGWKLVYEDARSQLFTPPARQPASTRAGDT